MDQRLVRVGTIRGRAAYWVSTGDHEEQTLAEAWTLVALDGLSLDIERAQLAARVVSLEVVLSPIVAVGRARQLQDEVRGFARRLEALPRAIIGGDKCRTELAIVSERIHGWLQFRSRVAGVPKDTALEVRGMTAIALRELLAPLNETAASMTNSGTVIRHYGRLIRRVRNPLFEGRRSGNAETAAMFLFDGVEARVYAARQWGGPKCQLMALWAYEELGELRDARYLRAALNTDDAEVRLRVLAGLALLGDEGAQVTLRHHARNDVHPGVRECALWGLGMVAGDEANDVLTETATHDPDAMVRRTAEQFLSIGSQWWWRA
jgi:hypothetical protein